VCNSDFWIVLHKLASELDKEGSSVQERVDVLLRQMEALPPEVLKAYLENLDVVGESIVSLILRYKTV